MNLKALIPTSGIPHNESFLEVKLFFMYPAAIAQLFTTGYQGLDFITWILAWFLLMVVPASTNINLNLMKTRPLRRHCISNESAPENGLYLYQQDFFSIFTYKVL